MARRGIDRAWLAATLLQLLLVGHSAANQPAVTESPAPGAPPVLPPAASKAAAVAAAAASADTAPPRLPVLPVVSSRAIGDANLLTAAQAAKAQASAAPLRANKSSSAGTAAAAAKRAPAASAAMPAAAVAPAAAAPAAKPAPSAAAAASPAQAANGTGAFHIGCVVPLTGPKANTGKAVQAAIEMAVADLGPKYLPGVKIEVTCEDTKCLDVPSLYGARKLARENVDVLVGDVCSAASLGALGVANKFRVPMVSPASTAPALSIKGDYFYRTVPSDRYQGQFAARKMLTSGAKSVVVASSSDSYGQELAYNFIAAFTRDGGKAVNVEQPAGVHPKNASAVVDAVRRANATGVFIATNDLFWASDIIKRLRGGPAPLNSVQIFGGDSLMDSTVPQTVGTAMAKGIRGSDVSYGSEDFVSAFKSFTSGKNVSYVPKAAHAYDAVEALLEAYRRAAAPKDGAAIIAEMPNVRFQGKSGPIAFDEFGDLKWSREGPRRYTVTEFDSNGDVVVSKDQ